QQAGRRAAVPSLMRREFADKARRSFEIDIDGVVLAGPDFKVQARLLWIAVARRHGSLVERHHGDTMPAWRGTEGIPSPQHITTVGLDGGLRHRPVVAACWIRCENDGAGGKRLAPE